MDWSVGGAGPLGEEDVEELRSERSIRGLKVIRIIKRDNNFKRFGKTSRLFPLMHFIDFSRQRK